MDQFKQALDVVETIFRYGRELIELSDMKEDGPREIKEFQGQLQHLREQLERLNSLCSLIEDVPDSRRQYIESNLSSCLTKLAELEASTTKTYKRSGKIFHRSYPSLTDKKAKEINENITALKQEIDLIYKDINEIVKSSETYKRVTDMVAKNPSEMYFDFESIGSDGQPLTCAGKMKAAVLGSSENRVVSIVAHGEGGVGKTCALRAIGQNKDVVNRFSGGVLYIELGQDAGEARLRERIARIVERSGGKEKAEDIRKQEELCDVVDTAGSWFASRTCLFLIDDIWIGRGITRETINTLSNLTKNDKSLIVYTTRDKKLQSAVSVEFSPRTPDSNEAKQILLIHANLKAPSSGDANVSFNSILTSCAGLPIALALSGRAVRYLAKNWCRDSVEKAWNMYQSNWEGDERIDMTKRLLKSLDFIDPSTDVHHRRFEALSFLRKSQTVSMKVISKLWGVEKSEAERGISAMERFSVVRCSVDDSNETFVSLHDIMLEISIERAGKNRCIHSRRLIKTFISGSPKYGASSMSEVSSSHETSLYSNVELTSQEFRNGFSVIITESDEYTLDNLCWLLRIAELGEEIFWVVSRPQWIVKRLEQKEKLDVYRDLDMADEFLQACSWTAENIRLGKYWTKRLRSAIRLSLNSLFSSSHKLMGWFQLYGRLNYLSEKSQWEKKFLEEIEERAPRPWIKPGPGLLTAAETHLKAEFVVEGKILCLRLRETLTDVLQVVNGDLVMMRYNYEEGTEYERTVVLKKSVSPDAFYTCASISDDGSTIVVGLYTGEVKVMHRGQLREVYCEANVTDNGDIEPWSRVEPDRTWEEVNGKWEESEVLTGHSSWVYSASMSADGKRVVSGSDDKTVRIWEEVNGKWEGSEVLTGHSRSINSVSMSADGKSVVSGSDDKTVQIWEEVNGKWEQSVVLTGHSSRIFSVSMSADGKRVVSGSYDKTVRIWNEVNGKWERSGVLTGHSSGIDSVSMSADGKRVVSGSDDMTVRIWEQVNGNWEQSGVLIGHSSGIDSVSMSADGKRVVSGSYDKIVRIWEEVNGKWEQSGVLTGHSDSINSVSMSAYGKRVRVVSGSDDMTVRIWKEVNGKWESVVLTGHSDSINSVSMSAYGKRVRVVSGSDDMTVRIWKEVNGKWEQSGVLTGHSSSINSVSMSAYGKRVRVVSGSDDMTVRIWEEVNGKWEQSVVLTGHSSRIFSVSMSADGKRVVSGSYDKTVRIWDEVNGKWERSGVLTGHSSGIDSVSMSADGKRVVSGSDDMAVRIWEEVNGKWERSVVLTGHSSSINSVSMSADGKRVASGSDDGTVRIWEEVNGKWEQSVVPTGHSDSINSVSMSADGKRVASGSDDGTVRIWEEVNGKWESVVPIGHSDSINSVSMSADGKRVVSGSDDMTVRIWEEVNGKWESVVLTGHSHPINSVSMSADGKRVVSGSYDKTVRIWEEVNGKWESVVPIGHSHPINSVSMSADGKRLESSDVKTVRIWEEVNGKWEEGSVCKGLRISASSAINPFPFENTLIPKFIGQVWHLLNPKKLLPVCNGYCFITSGRGIAFASICE